MRRYFQLESFDGASDLMVLEKSVAVAYECESAMQSTTALCAAHSMYQIR